MPQVRIFIGVIALVVFALIAPASRLLAEAPEPVPVPSSGALVPAETNVSPEMVAIRAALAEGRIQLDGLSTQLAAATDDQAAFALQKEIEQAKTATELRILGIQAAHARERGLTELANELDAAMAQVRGLPSAPAISDVSGATPDRR